MASFRITEISNDDIVLRVTITRSGSVLDITGCTAKFVARRASGGPILITKTTGDGIVLTTPGSGILTITILPSDTSSFTEDIILLAEVEITETDGRVTTVARGYLTVLKDVG